jgi:hypothetical protein
MSNSDSTWTGVELPAPLISYKATFATIKGYTADQMREAILAERERVLVEVEKVRQWADCEVTLFSWAVADRLEALKGAIKGKA